jgi:NTE family protein
MEKHRRESVVRIEEKTALVLSAGGMFGAYQAGAYKAIAELAPPDIVVGASVGALNGWPIASGCSPDHLIERWLDPAAGDALKLFPNHGWGFLGRAGWFDPAPLRAQAEGIWRDYHPNIPFGVVVVELPGLHARLVRYPNVLSAHLQATCSIPLFLPSVKIDGKRYLDGAIFEKVPIWAAIEMGATRIIAIDSMPKVGKWWLHLAIDIAYAFKPRRRYPPKLDLTIISPSETLGDTDDAVYWKRANIERWVDMGTRDARRVLSPDAARVLSPTVAGQSVTLR